MVVFPPEKENRPMKKLLSIVLAVLMLFSTVSYAAPSMAGTVSTASEETAKAPVVESEDVPEAATLAEESEYGTLVYDVDFDSASVTTMGQTMDKYSSVTTLPEGFPALTNTKFNTAFTEATIANGVLTGKSPSSSGYPNFLETALSSGQYPDGKYTLQADVKQITDGYAGYKLRTRLRGNGDLGVGTEFLLKYNDTVTFNYTFTICDGYVNTTAYTPVKNLNLYCTSGKNIDTFEIDYFKAYYSPVPKVSINVNGNSAFQNVEPYEVAFGTKITLDDLAAKYGYADTDDMYLLGMSTSASGFLMDTVTVDADTTIYLKWKAKKDVVTKHDKYGELLLLTDFEAVPDSIVKKDSVIGAYLYDGDQTTINSFSTYVKEEGLNVIGWNFQGDTPIADSNGTKYEALVFETDATGNVSGKVRIGVNRAQWQFANSAGIYKTHGAYTILFDAKTNMPQDLINTTTPSFGWYAFPDAKQTGMSKNWSNPTTDTWVRDIELIADFDTASRAYFMFGVESIGNNSSATAYDFYYDNVRVYWKPFNVNITIDANGNSEAQNAVYTADTSAKVDVDALNAKMGNTANKYFLGVSLTPDGELLTEDFWASEDTTVYAQWKDVALEHEQYGDLLYFTDFEDFSNAGSFYATKADGTVYLKEGWSLSKLGYTVASDFDSSKVYFDARGFGTDAELKAQSWQVVKDEVTGNTYVTHPVENGDPIQIIYADDGIYKNGVLTLVHDTMAKNTPNSYHDGYWINGDNQTYKWINSKFTGTAGAWEYDKAFTYDVDTAKHADFEYLYGIFFGYVGKATEQASYDNLRLYWKPYTANITIDMNGNTDKTVEVYVNDTSSVLSLEALASHVGAETANYTLVGFSKTADGEVLTEDFWANEDMTLYAVWEAKTNVTPESVNKSSIRTNGVSGIRFMGSITTAQKAEVTEYGFIVSLKAILGENELTHDSKVNYVEGINYGVVDGEDVDMIFKTEDDNIFFTAVVYGIPENKAAYESVFVVRPFSKRGNYYYYGASVERSVVEVAMAIRDGNYESVATEADKEFVKKVLTTCGESTEYVPEA